MAFFHLTINLIILIGNIHLIYRVYSKSKGMLLKAKYYNKNEILRRKIIEMILNFFIINNTIKQYGKYKNNILFFNIKKESR